MMIVQKCIDRWLRTFLGRQIGTPFVIVPDDHATGPEKLPNAKRVCKDLVAPMPAVNIGQVEPPSLQTEPLERGTRAALVFFHPTAVCGKIAVESIFDSSQDRSKRRIDR